jgi:hypothetical protein
MVTGQPLSRAELSQGAAPIAAREFSLRVVAP